jgi:eukaryotic-like serine/threonine-protein kinase
VAVTTPIKETMRDDDIVGIVGMAVEVGRFAKLQARRNHYAVLVDWRDGPYKGLILQHPLFDQMLEHNERLPERFSTYRLAAHDLPDTLDKQTDYVDPLGKDELGDEFDRRWLAKMDDVAARDGETGWKVIVQESYQAAIGDTLDNFKSSMWTSGLWAAGVIAVLSSALWALVLRMLAKSTRRITPPGQVAEPSLQTLA